MGDLGALHFLHPKEARTSVGELSWKKRASNFDHMPTEADDEQAPVNGACLLQARCRS